MSVLKDLSDGVTARCREEITRLGLKGVTFCAATGLPKQVFSAVSNGVNAAPTGFISALCRNFPADAGYIITGVRSPESHGNATAMGDHSQAVSGNGRIETSSDGDMKALRMEVEYLKAILAEKERLIDVLMKKL